MKCWIRFAHVANSLLLVAAFLLTVGVWCLIGLVLTGAISPLKVHWSVTPICAAFGVTFYNIHLWIDDKLFEMSNPRRPCQSKR